MLQDLRICWLAFGVTFVSVIASHPETKTMWVVSGRRVELPCKLDPKILEDEPLIVLWFRFSKTRPVYSYDARTAGFAKGVRWVDHETIGGRAYFNVFSDPPTLVLEPVYTQDEGMYTCRVDYRVSSSTTTFVNLTVVILPKAPWVTWRGRRVQGTVGPLTEGERVELTCHSTGGRPEPVLTWWRRGMQLPLLSTNVTREANTGTYTVETTLSVTATREVSSDALTCHVFTPTGQEGAEGVAFVQPRTATVSLYITLPPLEVKILEPEEEHVVPGAPIRLMCRSIGSHPPARLSWWRGHSHLHQVIHTTDENGNITTATLTMIVSRHHDGTRLTCTGVNPALPHSPLADSYRLTVYYAPVVELMLGRALDPSLIKEGDDVYFECDVKANPPFHSIDWYHNGVPLEHSANTGTVMSGSSLVMRGVDRRHSGSYVCEAVNPQATTRSNTVLLTVKHRPVCADGVMTRIQGVARGLRSSVSCTVEAEPSHGLIWMWVRTLADGSEMEIHAEDVRSEGASSVLLVTPNMPEDYGQVLCRATNSVGQQERSCVVTLVPAGPPDTPMNCTAAPILTEAHGLTALYVACVEGFNGGLKQDFLLETWQRGVLVANISSNFPEWKVTNLRAGVGVTMHIIAYNAHGSSNTLRMEFLSTSARPHSSPEPENFIDIFTTLGIILTGVGVLLLLSVACVFVTKRIRSRPTKKNNKAVVLPSVGDGYDPDVVQSIHCRPHSLDVLPPTSENDMCEHDIVWLSPFEGVCSDTRDLEVDNFSNKHGRISPSFSYSCTRKHSRHSARERQVESNSDDDSGLSEAESYPELHEHIEPQPLENIIGIKLDHPLHPAVFSDPCVVGKRATLVEGDRSEIIIVTRKSSLTEGMENGRPCDFEISSEMLSRKSQTTGPLSGMITLPRHLVSRKKSDGSEVISFEYTSSPRLHRYSVASESSCCPRRMDTNTNYLPASLSRKESSV